jgi:uridylate kinase
MSIKYQRVLLKISGEGFSGAGNVGISADDLKSMAEQIIELHHLGVQIAVVSGAGNLVRGATLSESVGLQRATADQMGMLATVINSLALQDTLTSLGVPAKVFSASGITSICETFRPNQAMEYLEKNHVVILAGGTGNPFFTTDTCASLRAAEIQANLLIKATKVDGVYDTDPVTNPSAKRYEKLSFTEVLNQNLGIMDLSAIVMCKEYNIDIVVCNLMKNGTVCRVVQGETAGTLISNSC